MYGLRYGCSPPLPSQHAPKCYGRESRFEGGTNRVPSLVQTTEDSNTHTRGTRHAMRTTLLLDGTHFRQDYDCF